MSILDDCDSETAFYVREIIKNCEKFSPKYQISIVQTCGIFLEELRYLCDKKKKKNLRLVFERCQESRFKAIASIQEKYRLSDQFWIQLLSDNRYEEFFNEKYGCLILSYEHNFNQSKENEQDSIENSLERILSVSEPAKEQS